jgi:hypothetical protein
MSVTQYHWIDLLLFYRARASCYRRGELGGLGTQQNSEAGCLRAD